MIHAKSLLQGSKGKDGRRPSIWSTTCKSKFQSFFFSSLLSVNKNKLLTKSLHSVEQQPSVDETSDLWKPAADLKGDQRQPISFKIFQTAQKKKRARGSASLNLQPLEDWEVGGQWVWWRPTNSLTDQGRISGVPAARTPLLYQSLFSFFSILSPPSLLPSFFRLVLSLSPF